MVVRRILRGPVALFRPTLARSARIRLRRPGRRCGVSRWGGATTWIVLTCVLRAAVLGLGLGVLVLETRVNDLEAQLEAEKAAAGAASEEAQKQLEAVRADVESASNDLGAKGQE